MELSLTSDYSTEEGRWSVGVLGQGGALTFGRYQVSDATAEITPEDATAIVLMTPGVRCAEPATVLSKGPVPPQFAMAAAPAPAPVIDSGSRAELEVWVRVYSCYSTFPELSNFVAYEQGDGKWVVEGKSNTTQFGLWQVDGMSGSISPMDGLALQAAAECSLSTSSSFPPAVLGTQAELRVWAAVYDCFNHPQRTSFTSYTDSPQRWLVEGRQEEVRDPLTGTVITPAEFFGVWTVDAVSGEIRPWDGEANGKFLLSCFKSP
jgi:hypothetical protein